MIRVWQGARDQGFNLLLPLIKVLHVRQGSGWSPVVAGESPAVGWQGVIGGICERTYLVILQGLFGVFSGDLHKRKWG